MLKIFELKNKNGDIYQFRYNAGTIEILARGAFGQEWLEATVYQLEKCGFEPDILAGYDQETDFFWLFEQIICVANSQTDFDSGFDRLFRFMAENPESETTKGFIEYHQIDLNNPKTPSGDADFTYLIGKVFVPDHWILEDDLPAYVGFLVKTEAEEVELVVKDGDINWYIARLGTKWAAWDNAAPKPQVCLYDTRDEAIQHQRSGFEAAGLPEECWLLEE